MEVKITKITNLELLRDTASFTIGHNSKLSLKNAYKSEHSPIRTQMFKIEMFNIPSFVSVHFARHKFGVEHFVKSNRDDRPDVDFVADRNTLVNHCMWINAQELINMSKVRLCKKSSIETQTVMKMIVDEIKKCDRSLGKFLVPSCIYRNGLCPEKTCGYKETTEYKERLNDYLISMGYYKKEMK